MAVEKLSKSFILRLTPDRVHFVISHRGLDNSIQLWGQISAVITHLLRNEAEWIGCLVWAVSRRIGEWRPDLHGVAGWEFVKDVKECRECEWCRVQVDKEGWLAGVDVCDYDSGLVWSVGLNEAYSSRVGQERLSQSRKIFPSKSCLLLKRPSSMSHCFPNPRYVCKVIRIELMM